MLLTSLVSATNFPQDTILNTSLSNTSIGFHFVNVTMDRLVIDANSILLQNVSYVSQQGVIFNLSTDINQITTNSLTESAAFPYILPYLVGFSSVSILSNISNTVNANLSNISSNCPVLTQISYTSATGFYTHTYTGGEIICSGNQVNNLFIQGIESTNGNNNTLTFTYSSPIPPVDGGGGGAIAGSQNENKTYLCLKTFDYINTYGTSPVNLNKLTDVILKETNTTPSVPVLENYLYSWESICSDLTNLTLNENFVCSKVYYFLKDNYNSYTAQDIETLRQEISPTTQISSQVLSNYVQNYDNKCERVINIPNSNITNLFCDTSTHINFIDFSVPFWTINLNQPTCNTIQKIKAFVKVENSENNTSIVGIRFYLIILFLIILYILNVKFIAEQVKKRFKKIELNIKDFSSTSE